MERSTGEPCMQGFEVLISPTLSAKIIAQADLPFVVADNAAAGFC